jgi:hypothetical protein
MLVLPARMNVRYELDAGFPYHSNALSESCHPPGVIRRLFASMKQFTAKHNLAWNMNH